MPTLQDAIELAVHSHRGQTDKAGQPYILHPLRLMMQFTKEHERIVAVLHDVIEDTNVTMEKLTELGYDEEIRRAIEHLTRRPDENYEQFIKRVVACDLARRVKIADLEDNMDLRRLKVVTEKDLERQRRYHSAWEWLMMMSVKP